MLLSEFRQVFVMPDRSEFIAFCVESRKFGCVLFRIPTAKCASDTPVPLTEVCGSITFPRPGVDLTLIGLWCLMLCSDRCFHERSGDQTSRGIYRCAFS